MRKRTIIALVLTILCVAAANRYWLIFKPFSVQFYIKGDGVASIEVLLNKKNNAEFKKVKRGGYDIDLSKSSKFYVTFSHVTSPKRLKLALRKPFDLSGGGGAGSLAITGLELRDGKYKLKDLENFSAENADIKINGDSLVITPKSENFSIVYNKPLKVRSSIKFDFKLFVIITVLSFLLFYKLTDYLADFKTLKNQSRTDIIFLLIFFILLFVPMVKLDTKVFSEKELRTLAKYQPFITDNKINYDWGNNYNNYFSDHFYLRDEIIKYYDRFKYFIAYKNYVLPGHAILNKSTNWGFRIEPYSLAVYDDLSDETVKRIVSNLTRLNDFCNSHNIKFYLVVVPAKEDIYKEQNIYKPAGKNENFNKIYEYAKKNTDLKIVFPAEQFKSLGKTNFVFFKTDHHWTHYGAFTGYTLLANEIKKDFPQFLPETKKDFDISKNKLVLSDFTREYTTGQTLYAFLNLDDKKIAEKVLDVEYPYYIHKKHKSLKTDIDYDNKIKDFHFPAKNNLTALEIGNSQSENFNSFLPYSFKHLRYLRANNSKRKFVDEIKMSGYENEILKMKPDILILTVSSAYIIPLKNMYESEN